MICGNALEQDISRATCFFLYLVPRGLRIILKKLIADIPLRRFRLRVVDSLVACMNVRINYVFYECMYVLSCMSMYCIF